jgi:hypothetical protein
MQGVQATINLNGESCLSDTAISKHHQFVKRHLSSHDDGLNFLSKVKMVRV